MKRNLLISSLCVKTSAGCFCGIFSSIPGAGSALYSPSVPGSTQQYMVAISTLSRSYPGLSPLKCSAEILISSISEARYSFHPTASSNSLNPPDLIAQERLVIGGAGHNQPQTKRLHRTIAPVIVELNNPLGIYGGAKRRPCFFPGFGDI